MADVPRPIGYYVHHHGDGHRRRALAIAAHAQGRVVLLGTGLTGRTGDVPAIDLPDDRLPSDDFAGRDGVDRQQALHYAPFDHAGIRARVATIGAWIDNARPALMVVDVSVEIAMLARLASVPVVYVRLNGRRDDVAHLEAFRGATALLAPFHPDLDDRDTSASIRERTFYAPGLGGRSVPAAGGDDVLVVLGKGGAQGDGAAWAAIARAVPDRQWRVIGPCTPAADPPANLHILGWVDDADAMIASAGMIVGAAGDGLVGAVIATGRPFICVPEERPFAEQTSKAARLEALGAAVVCPPWPAPADWPDLLEQARRLDPDALSRLDDADGARRAADWLIATADRMHIP
jgi:predicted glycosyltransferase